MTSNKIFDKWLRTFFRFCAHSLVFFALFSQSGRVAFADDEGIDKTPKARPGELLGRFSIGVVGSAVGAFALGLGGAIVSSALGSKHSGECSEGCAGLVLGVFAGIPLGAAAGIHLLSEPENVQSSFWFTSLGALVGEAASIGALVAIGGSGDAWGNLLIPLGMTSAMGTGAYQWSRGYKEEPQTGFMAPRVYFTTSGTMGKVQIIPMLSLINARF